jgi:PleD family two-component response regulator
MGLAMVYGMAHRHGADLEIESEPGRGTLVRITYTQADADPAALSVPSAAPHGPLRILVVDDDPLVIRALADALQADGHSVVAASGGQAAIDAFASALTAGIAYEVVITGMERFTSLHASDQW